MLTCTKCGESKTPDNFTSWPRNKWCRACAAAYQRELRQRGYKPTGRNKALDALGAAGKAKAMRLTRCVIQASHNAKKLKRAFNITTADLPDTDVCMISGLPLSYEAGSPWVVSIDCIDPALGYVPGNVQLVCWAVNRAKGDLTPDDFRLLCKSLGGLAQD